MFRELFLGVGLQLAIAGSALLAAAPNAEWFPQAPPLPKPTGAIVHASDVKELLNAVESIAAGGTILIADGHYAIPRYFEITADNVTLRSASGDRTKVILDGASNRHGELVGVGDCQGVTIADLTVQNVRHNGIKINSDRGAQRVTVHNCVLHNIWQRGVKAPGLRENAEEMSPRDCRVQYCLFYNDRPKQFSDDETDTPKTFNGNYIGGIDVKNTLNWRITDNVFIGIQGRTREGRGCIYISEDGRNCLIERNIFLDCDIAIALGNPSLEIAKHHAVNCIARNNFVSQCPETGILACYTTGCEITENTIFDPQSSRRRLIWVQNANDGLSVTNNLLIGPAIQVTSKSKIVNENNAAFDSLSDSENQPEKGVGQDAIAPAQLTQLISFPAQQKEAGAKEEKALLAGGVQSAEVIAAMRKVHEGFKGQKGYVAQFGDSITYSMAFWSAMSWSSPDEYLTQDDGLPKTPGKVRWRDYIKGARDKGPKFANYSGWKVGQLNKAVDDVLKRDKPEFAIIMIGTNDINGNKVPPSYQDELKKVIGKCLDAHCIPILNTIPPRRGHEESVDGVNKIIRNTAKELSIPMVDFYAECLRLRPGTSWDGTIISKDGVHPSGGKTNIYTADNMKNCGYALRNWVNFLAIRQVYFQACTPKE